MPTSSSPKGENRRWRTLLGSSPEGPAAAGAASSGRSATWIDSRMSCFACPTESRRSSTWQVTRPGLNSGQLLEAEVSSHINPPPPPRLLRPLFSLLCVCLCVLVGLCALLLLLKPVPGSGRRLIQLNSSSKFHS